MRPLTAYLSLLLTILLCPCGECDPERVSPELHVSLTPDGGVVGSYETSQNGRRIRAFYAIPYAEPPLGKLRFANPIPIRQWTGRRILPTVEQQGCIQRQFHGSQIHIPLREDCLYLNVFTPVVKRNSNKFPVIIHLSGRSMLDGTGRGAFRAPTYLLDHDVVLVTGNYRVGITGFLTTGSKACPGNFGLKDQVLILKWVKQYIENFHGNSKSVTLMGANGGAASVGFHMISRQSEGLFHRAIMQGGAPHSLISFEYTGAHNRLNQLVARRTGCGLGGQKTEEDFINCLREINPWGPKHIEIQDFFWRDYPMEGFFLPVREPYNSNGFITANPGAYVDSHGLKIPLLIGNTAQDGIVRTALLKDNHEKMAQFDVTLDNFICLTTLACADYEKESPRRDLIKKFYFPHQTISNETFDDLTLFQTDNFFMAPTDELLTNRLVKHKDSAITYIYHYDYKREASVFSLITKKYRLNNQTVVGVSNGDDILPIFPIATKLLSTIVPTEKDAYVQKTMTQMWVNFATTSDPNIKGNIDFDWKPARSYPLNYLRVGHYDKPWKNVFSLEQNLAEDRMAVWRKVRNYQHE